MMNFSKSMNPKREQKRRGTYWVDLAVGLAVGFLVALAICKITTMVDANGTPVDRPVVDDTSLLPETLTNHPTHSSAPSVEPENVFLGPCRITAYCACEKCCGKWALNRANGIVYGAAGIELQAGVSVASPWPVGTVVEIEGMGEYIVQDRPAQWVIDKYGENQFDIYFDNHEAARSFGLQYLNVTVKEEPK